MKKLAKWSTELFYKLTYKLALAIGPTKASLIVSTVTGAVVGVMFGISVMGISAMAGGLVLAQSLADYIAGLAMIAIYTATLTASIYITINFIRSWFSNEGKDND